MTAFVFAISLVLAGQVGLADERYSGFADPLGGEPFQAEVEPIADERDQVITPLDQPPPSPPPVTPSSPPVERPEAEDVKPSAQLRAILTPHRDSRLSGEPTALADVLAGIAGRDEQSRRIAAYWDLTFDVADYYLSLRELDESQRRPADAIDIAARVRARQQAVLASQHRLASLIGRSDASLPLPIDVPHCGDYDARYDEIFAGRPTPEAQHIAELLPLQYAELREAAAAVAQAEAFLQNADTRASLEPLIQRRRALVNLARDYNRRIARYSELVAPGYVESQRLIGMLIPHASPPTATAATPATRSSVSTYAEGWVPVGDDWRPTTTRDESVRPAAAEGEQILRKERSLLVRPQ